MLLNKVHHVAYVVQNIDEALATFGKTLDLHVVLRKIDDHWGYEFVLCPIGDFIIEIISPVREDAIFNQKLQARGGPFIDHVAYGVHNLDEVVEMMKAAGVGIHGQPEIAPAGFRAVHLDPADTMGIRTQIVDLDYQG
jgi:catechol 2,3-dioxygenase-like lactoylglutathione lyase family enzyme